MLATNKKSGKSPGVDQDLPSSDQLDSQVIQEYREIYLQIAIKVQSLMSMGVSYTYDQLYRLGCNHPPLSYRIDILVGYELRLGGYSLNDQVNALFYGPYVQSQILHYQLSESGARHYIRQRLAIAPSAPSPLELQSELVGTAA